MHGWYMLVCKYGEQSEGEDLELLWDNDDNVYVANVWMISKEFNVTITSPAQALYGAHSSAQTKAQAYELS